ncbi:Phr family secreted Rap phosphatase inhibitor [Bacillus cereus group sp. Bc011]|nr:MULTISPECIES: Phr family secreted Rap phosphatase inhibitor [unclassified Bacillus cereus group]MDA2681103.1 Phr family secreted Rap phosphatase inhibitor [Bacillus cereus group sp. Bc029]MDA2742063.1 Phr family secreted Rap phosphatase inhibitor [Bacillus cereus group sp. Bc011]
MKKLKVALLGVVSIAFLSFGFSQPAAKGYSAKAEKKPIVLYTEGGMGI